MVLHEAEMTQHGMILGEAELAVDYRVNRRKRRAVELHALAAHLQVHALEHSHEVKMPVGAARLAIRDDLQAHIFLQLDQRRNFGVLEGPQLGGGDTSRTGLGNTAGAKETADMIGTEGRRCGHVFGKIHLWHSEAT